MEIAHFNQRQLAARWDISEATLERWRSKGIGSKYLKICGRVLYRLVDIEAYEERCSVSAGFVRVHDAAWSGEPAGAAANSDRDSSGVSLADVAEVSAENARICRTWREQALGWREFYRGLQKATAKNE